MYLPTYSPSMAPSRHPACSTQFEQGTASLNCHVNLHHSPLWALGTQDQVFYLQSAPGLGPSSVTTVQPLTFLGLPSTDSVTHSLVNNAHPGVP